MPVPTPSPTKNRRDTLCRGALSNGRKFQTLNALCKYIFSTLAADGALQLKLITSDERVFLTARGEDCLMYNNDRSVSGVLKDSCKVLCSFIHERCPDSPVNIVACSKSRRQTLWACVDVKNELYAVFCVERR